MPALGVVVVFTVVWFMVQSLFFIVMECCSVTAQSVTCFNLKLNINGSNLLFLSWELVRILGYKLVPYKRLRMSLELKPPSTERLIY